MAIEEEKQRIVDLWGSINTKIKTDLANVWEEREELGELEARIEKLEPKVIQLLQVIPSLKRHSHEYHARTVDLVKLLHHVKSNEEWYERVRKDLEYFIGEINKARNAFLQSGTYITKPSVSHTTQKGEAANVEVYDVVRIKDETKGVKVGLIEGRYEKGSPYYINKLYVECMSSRQFLIEIADRFGFKDEVINALKKSGRNDNILIMEIICDFRSKEIPISIRNPIMVPRQDLELKTFPEGKGQIYLKQPISVTDYGGNIKLRLEVYN